MLQEERELTYEDLLNKLLKYKKCALIRPTGFGKTHILTRLIKLFNASESILYLYPSTVVKDTVLSMYYKNAVHKGYIDNVVFMSYYKLVVSDLEDIIKQYNFSFIIADECHRLGANKSIVAFNKLLEGFPNATLVGASATPDRMDGVDEITDLFDGITVYPYTLHDAFKDGLLQRPYYCYCTYGDDDINELKKNANLEIEKMGVDREEANSLLKSYIIEISKILNMEDTIKVAINRAGIKISYMKFIVFFSSIEHLNSKSDDVLSWFKAAYPSHAVSKLVISSETEKYKSNVNNLGNLERKENKIDLVFCIDMLNMGYHVKDLTGIVMYRGTQSNIVYAQQLGRVLNSNAKNKTIVFDIVDNLHRAPVYSIHSSTYMNIEEKKDRIQCLKFLKDSYEKTGKTLSKEESAELKRLIKEVEEYTERYWWKDCNNILPKDLIAVGNEATYRELMSKVVGEIISMRCKQAWQRWVNKGGDPGDFTRTCIMSRVPPEFVPLEPFCRLKDVTVNQVLDVMGIK